MSDHNDGELGRGGRSRRSAATGNKAWAALMPKHAKEEEYENDSPAKTPRKRQRKSRSPVPKAEPPESKPVTPFAAAPSPAARPLPGQMPSIAQPRVVVTKSVTVVNGAANAAASKDQIDNIEKEMRNYMSNEEDETIDDEDTFPAFDGDDDDDEEYSEQPVRKSSRRATPRGRGAPPRSTRGAKSVEAPAVTHYPVANMMDQRFMQMPPRGAPPGRYVVRSNLPPPRYASTSYAIQENRPLKMVVIKPAPKSLVAAGDSLVQKPLTISSMSALATKDLEALNKKYGERLVPGDSVHKFNALVATLHEEIKVLAEDRERMLTNHQELVEQMNLAHSTALDIKDGRIRQLESCVTGLQTKLSNLTRQVNLALSQHESVPPPESTSQQPQESTSQQPAPVLQPQEPVPQQESISQQQEPTPKQELSSQSQQ